MRRRTPLSPGQSAAYTAGRTLLVFDCWARHADTAIEFDRAMLIDFAVQYPRSIRSLIATVPPILRAHGIEEGDLGDLFVTRHLDTMREDFVAVVAMLVSRRLVNEENGSVGGGGSTWFRISSEGRSAAASFSSSLSIAIRALAEAATLAWKRRNTEELRTEVRTVLPDSSRDAAELARPVDFFGEE